MPSTIEVGVDADEIRGHIRTMYREVAEQPGGDFHFEMGRPLAERLGYPAVWLDAVPPAALASFAGVGHLLDLAELRPGDRVVDLGSGAGTDAFIAALLVAPTGSVVGVDMTGAQLTKARELRIRHRVQRLSFAEGLVEDPPIEPCSADAVISNGVINLVPDKPAVFRAAARILRPGGRLALADIVAERPLKERTRNNAQLWAACIAGAVPLEEYLGAIEGAGLEVTVVRSNPAYAFRSTRAIEAAERYGVASVSIQAVKA